MLPEAGSFSKRFQPTGELRDSALFHARTSEGAKSVCGVILYLLYFYKTIKAIEHHPNLDDPRIVLNSFVISNTPYREISWRERGITKADLEQCHVLF